MALKKKNSQEVKKVNPQLNGVLLGDSWERLVAECRKLDGVLARDLGAVIFRRAIEAAIETEFSEISDEDLKF